MPSIITKEEFELVLAKRKRNKKRTGSYRPVDPYILSGILTCSKCGSPYYGQKSKRNKKDVTYSYHKYMCSHRNKIDKCTGANINRDDIETLVMNELQKLLLLPSNLDILVNKVNEKYLELNDNNNIDSSNIENELTVVQNKINNFMRLIADGIYNDDIKNNISNLEDEKNNLNIKLKSYTDVPKIKKISKADILDILKLDIKNLKSSDKVILKNILNKYIEKIVVNFPQVEVKFKVNFANFQKSSNMQKINEKYNSLICLAPLVGLEPTTYRLTGI